MNQFVKRFALSCMLLPACSSLQAAFSTYTGIDLNPNAVGTLANKNTVVAPLNTLAAENSFLSQLAPGYGTETFESFGANPQYTFSDVSPYGPAPIPLTFGSFGTASLTGSVVNYTGRVREQASGTTNTQGRYTISGNHYFESGITVPNPPVGLGLPAGFNSLANGDFTITFNPGTAVTAFGFYATDIGDSPNAGGVGGQLQVTFSLLGGGTYVAPLLGDMTTPGGIVYFGVTTDDLLHPFTSVTFHNTIPDFDYVGYDNFTIGAFVVPEPGMLTIWGLGALAVGLVTSRRKVLA